MQKVTNILIKLTLIFILCGYAIASPGSEKIGFVSGVTTLKIGKESQPGYKLEAFYANDYSRHLTFNEAIGYNQFRPIDNSIHMAPLTLSGRYHPLESRLSPFMEIGVGASLTYSPKIEDNRPYIDLLAQSGIGVEYPLNKNWSFNIATHYGITTSALLDGK